MNKILFSILLLIGCCNISYAQLTSSFMEDTLYVVNIDQLLYYNGPYDSVPKIFEIDPVLLLKQPNDTLNDFCIEFDKFQYNASDSLLHISGKVLEIFDKELNKRFPIKNCIIVLFDNDKIERRFIKQGGVLLGPAGGNLKIINTDEKNNLQQVRIFNKQNTVLTDTIEDNLNKINDMKNNLREVQYIMKESQQSFAELINPTEQHFNCYFKISHKNNKLLFCKTGYNLKVIDLEFLNSVPQDL